MLLSALSAARPPKANKEKSAETPSLIKGEKRGAELDPRAQRREEGERVSFFSNKECALKYFKVLKQHVYHLSSND